METVAPIETIALDPVQLNEELVYQPKPAPADRTQILYHQYAPKDQYWRNDPDELHIILGLPQIFFDWNQETLTNQENTIYDEFTGVLTHLDIDDTRTLQELRDRELRRRQEGIHFFNNGKIEYMTGNNYAFLVYYKIPEVGNPHYRKFQRDIHYVLDMAVKDPNILGAFIIKAKKTGVSHIMASKMLNEAMMIRNRAFGVMNKTQDDANDLNINFMWLAWQEYPPIMKPNVSHKNLSKIVFGQPLVKYTGTKASVMKAVYQQRNKPLNTWIYSAPTSKKLKFDGPMMFYIHGDEVPKWDEVKAIFDKMTETVKLQQTIKGKIFFTSYPPEEDTKGFFEAKEIYFNSKLSTIQKDSLLPRTASGLICYCVSALVSTDGTFDIYGEADEARALALNQAERDQCKNAQELQAKVRQYGRNEQEMWRSGGSGSTFDNNHLSAALANLESLERTSTEPLYVDGDLYWENGVRLSRALWTPRTEFEKKNTQLGWWRQYESYPEYYYNRVYKDERGMWTPHPDCKFMLATDPTEYKNASQIAGNAPSNSAIVGMSFPDIARNTMMGRVASNLVVLEYLNRREDPNDYLEDVILTLWRLGCYILVEANKAWLVKMLVDAGLANFILVRLPDRSIVPYSFGVQSFNGVTTTNDVIEAYCRLGSSYLRTPRKGAIDEVDYAMLLRSERLINQLMNFNPNMTKKYDLAVCFLLCLLAMSAFSVFQQLLKDKQKKLDHISQFAKMICDYVH